MKELVFLLGLVLLIAADIIGVIRYKQLDIVLRLVVLLIIITTVVEITAYIVLLTKKYEAKNVVYHTFNIVELILVTSVFLKINKPYRYEKLMVVNIILWPVLGILNTIFLQPLSGLNSNILMLESFCIITMSLYTIYRILKNDVAHNMFFNPYFWLSAIWLIEWSSTFFFWAFIKILYKDHWDYINLAMDLNNIINIIVYGGIGVVLFSYPKMIKAFENS